ncbi:MAG: hypothetical protein QG669_252 [Patescibacteria group bacterium]|nr:hypothetical protein [Patescibacteria group bacterium]
MSTTTDKNDPRLLLKGDDGQMHAYFVLSQEEKSKGFIRPIRGEYVHKKCATVTRMNSEIAESFARDPKLYSHTYCVKCINHFPVSEFLWKDSEENVGD